MRPIDSDSEIASSILIMMVYGLCFGLYGGCFFFFFMSFDGYEMANKVY